MNVLNIKTKGSALIVEKPIPRITSGGRNCYTLRVTFDSSWDCPDGKYFASFYTDSSNNSKLCELERDGTSFKCIIPDAVTANEGVFKFGLWCESGDVTIPSDVKMIRVYRGILVSSNESIPPEEEEPDRTPEETLIAIEKLITESEVIAYDDTFNDFNDYYPD